MTNQPTPLDASVFHECVNEWLSWVRQYSKLNINNLLKLIGSLKTLHLLQESAPPLPKEWPVILDHFNQNRNLNLWNELYEPVILDQAKILLLYQWNTVFDRVRAEIDSVTKKIIENRSKEPEDNLHWFLWDSLEDDISARSNTKVDSKKSKDLTIKSLGLSPNSGKICIFLESLISNVVDELSNMNSEKGLDSEQSTFLKHHQKSCCLELVEKLLNLVLELADSSAISDAVIIFLARFLSGIAPLCSSLKQCIILIDEKGDEWSTVNAKLHEKSLDVWRKWYSRTSLKIFSEFNSIIMNSNVSSFRMKHMPRWDMIIIKQENEDGANVESELKVPFQASFPVQNLLNSLASMLACTLPPRIISVEMVDDVLSKALQCVTESCNEDLHQSVCIQFLFDVKYLFALLIPIENDKLTVQYNDAISKIESKVDPVDLDCITSYLSENVNQFAFKTQGLYGLLMNNKSRIVVNQYADNSNDPNVAYNGGTNVPWFPLLPVSTIYASEK